MVFITLFDCKYCKGPSKVEIVLEQREVAFLSISLLKFKFLQILLGYKNATSLCSKNISILQNVYDLEGAIKYLFKAAFFVPARRLK